MPSVSVYRPAGRRFFYAQWTDPVTGRKKTRSTGKAKRRDAERWAGRLMDDIDSGAIDRAAKVTWEVFRKRYEAEVLAGKGDKTAAKERTTLNAVERYVQPRLLVSLDAGTISRFRAKLLELDRAGYTIQGHLKALGRMLTWAHQVGMIPAVPLIPTQQAVATRGRPVTAEEFDRMLLAVERSVPPESVDSWQWLLRGLWWSGLRLSEALSLHWTDDRKLCIDLTGDFPMFRIRAGGQKSRKDCLLPMAREFAEMLDEVAGTDRRGLVFSPRPLRPPFDVRLRSDSVSKRITAFGKQARIVVSHRGDTPKYASAHDLRRAFGFRWAQRTGISVLTLQKMMRHENIATTREFYARIEANDAAQAAWSASANTATNTPKPAKDSSSTI